MKIKKPIIVISIVVAMTGVASAMVAGADSWSISGHYLRLNQANPSGSTDNVGIGVSYDWLMSPSMTFGVEFIGSWDNPAELYGGGINTKFHMDTGERADFYGGAFIDYFHARGLPSRTQGGPGGSADGYIYGPLVGIKVPCTESRSFFAQYQYGWIDGGNLRKAFDEANWLTFGIEMKF